MLDSVSSKKTFLTHWDRMSALALSLYHVTAYLAQNYLFVCFFIPLDGRFLDGRAHVFFIFAWSLLNIVTLYLADLAVSIFIEMK